MSWIPIVALALFAGHALIAEAQNSKLRRERADSVPLNHHEFFQVSQLTSEYTRFRAASGRWPQPNEIVRELVLVQSGRDTRHPMRVDVYRTSLPEVAVQFQLRDDGALHIKVEP